MLQPGVYDIKLQRRADYSLMLQFKDKDGVPINLTGWTAVAQAWDLARTIKYADFNIAYTDRALGKITISLTATQTATFIRELQYDVLLINANNIREYYLEGTINASEGYSEP